jgi:hypothetical protein
MTDLERGRKYLYNSGETLTLNKLNKEGDEYIASNDTIILKSGEMIQYIERIDKTYKNINNRDKIIGHIEYIFKKDGIYCGFRIIIENEPRINDLIKKLFIPQHLGPQGGGKIKRKKRKTRSRL